jgi:hypothetical protein
MVAVHRKNEISLFGNYYPISGPVEEILASQFAPKQVIGDYTKDSELLSSSWVISDQRGGIGIKDMEEFDSAGNPKDIDRCWFSDAWLNTRGHRTLPPLTTKTTNPTSSDAAVLIEFQNIMYCAFGVAVYTWNEGTSAWISASHSLVSVPTGAMVHKDKLYFFCTTDFERFDGTNWTDGDTLGSVQKCILGVEWDNKLMLLDESGQLDYSTDEGVTFITNALSTLPNGFFTSLFKFDDAAGEVIVYMGTKEGLFALDFDNDNWVETNLRMPTHDFNAKGADSWRDAAFIPSGMAMARYSTNPAGVVQMGLDRDGGLPSDYTGSIVQVLPGHNALYALLDATTTLNKDLQPAGEYGDIQIYDNEGRSAVFRWEPPPHGGWSLLSVGGAADTPLTTGTIATADDIYRIWFGIDSTVSFVPLQVTQQNPKETAGYEFALTSEHITPWFDADNAVVDKLAVELAGFYDDLAADDQEYVMLYYATDYDDDTWTLLTNSTFTDGKIDVSGETLFTFASEQGLAVQAIRFRELMFRRASDNTKSPDNRWLRLRYIKLLTPQYAFGVLIDCSHNYRFQTSKTLLAALKSAVANRTLGAFTFRDKNGSETHRVRIANMEGAEIGGKKNGGVYKVSLVAP